MGKKEPYRFRASDALAAVFVLCLAVVSFFLFYHSPRETAGSVEIYQNGKLLYTLNLYEDQAVTVSGDYENIIVIENGTVHISSSTCPGQVCVHMGSISTSGQSLICLPNRLEVRLSGESDDVDIIAR